VYPPLCASVETNFDLIALKEVKMNKFIYVIAIVATGLLSSQGLGH
jgi:hypothetical protein